MSQVNHAAADQPFTEKLMPVNVGLDEAGQPTTALLKKLAAKGLEALSVKDLGQVDDGKQAYLVAQGIAPGALLSQALEGALAVAISELPIPKVMRYQLADGMTSVNFVRPAHRLLALHGKDIVPITALGLTASRQTGGHRFLCTDELTIESADTYERQLEQQGRVTASFAKRRADIEAALVTQATELGASLGQDPQVDALLDEVTALVEAPAIYVGQFEQRFLDVPPECLILTMRLNQKYFPLFDPATKKLTHQFLIVSNMPIANPAAIIGGNERVIRPRLADAEFFYLTDKRQALSDRVSTLGSMVYHNKLGTQLARAERIGKISKTLAPSLGADTVACERAALLAKADLTTQMVGEFPELQGIMGAYYAQADTEPDSVVQAIKQQYQTRWLTPVHKNDLVAAVLFMADRAETLIGIWGIGLAPTGERDPFGLRRAALGLISVFEQLREGGYLPLSGEPKLTLETVLQAAWTSFGSTVALAPDTLAEVIDFVRERYRNQLSGQYAREAVEAVMAIGAPLHQWVSRVQAAQAFMQSADAPSLVAANKRIGNLLKKAQQDFLDIDVTHLKEPAEQALALKLNELAPLAEQQVAAAQFGQALTVLAALRPGVDAFFEQVMVMADDPLIRQNRLALLARLHRVMNQVADISRLAS
jgi:glycyl-tRNA synthetase beta chain